MPDRLDQRERVATWAVRAAFAAVFAVNVWCALAFVLAPGNYAGAYELTSAGVAGETAVRGMGIVFLMWNATYPALIAEPQRFRALGWVILAQQAIGLVGEAVLLLTLPAGHDVLAASVVRFIAYDSAGLVAMGVTWALLMREAQRHHVRRPRRP